MPATHPERAWQVSCARDEVLASQQLNEVSSSHGEDLGGDLGLNLSFLGCPSNSSKITVPTPGPCNDQTDRCDRPSVTSMSNDRPSTKRPSSFGVVWRQDQGQNNNWCSESIEVEDTIHGNDRCENVEDTNESHRADETLSNRIEEQSDSDLVCSSSSSGSSIELFDQDRGVLKTEENPGSRGLGEGSEHKRSLGFRNPDTGKQSVGSKTKGPFRESDLDRYQTQEDVSPRQSAKQSGSNQAGFGRALTPRMHRSPQRSPSRRKKGDGLHGSSAPGPVIPMPAQTSIGFTNISRPSSASPSRREDLRPPAKTNGPRPSAAPDTFTRASSFRAREVSGSADTLSDMRRSLSTKLPSPSLAAANLHRSIESLAPTPSLAEADLRDRRRSSQQTESPAPTEDLQQIQCQLILPEDAWYTAAPHGDIQQTSPQKMLEMTRLALYEQQVLGQQQQQASELQQRKKSSYHKNHSASLAMPDVPTDILGSVKIPTTEVSASSAGPRSNTKAARGLEDNKTALSSSCGTLSGSGSAGRPRSSRRHPVLDKMFRHVLASLMMESGPPSSACLASVLDQVEGQGTTDSLRSLSRTSSTSIASSITSRYQNSRFGAGGSRLYGGKVKRGVENSSEDATLSLTSTLPCTLVKINEEVKTSCPPGQGEAAAATADA